MTTKTRKQIDVISDSLQDKKNHLLWIRETLQETQSQIPENLRSSKGYKRVEGEISDIEEAINNLEEAISYLA